MAVTVRVMATTTARVQAVTEASDGPRVTRGDEG